MKKSPQVRQAPKPQHGMTLIELMVALVIGLVLSLAIFAVLSTFEGRKRTTTSVNDINQSGNYAMYAIDKWVRSAGSGFAQTGPYTFGCPLYAAKSGTQILPITTANPLRAPFTSVVPGSTAGLFRLAPLLILPGATTPGMSGQASDVLVVMAGNAGYGEAPIPFSTFATASTLKLLTTATFKAGDIALVADKQGNAAGLSACMIEQATSNGGAFTDLPLSGTYASATVGSQNLISYTSDGVAMSLGNIAGGNPPGFLLIGVGDNDTLFSYDLLQPATASTAIADGVFEMHALYGIDTDSDGKVDSWVPPSTTGTYSLANLTSGTSTAAELLQTIKAVRIGLIMRTSLPEKNAVEQSSVVTTVGTNKYIYLFKDLGTTLQYARQLDTTSGSTEQNYRYRTIESTIPLRNTMVLN